MERLMSRLGIEMLSLFGLSPVEHVALAADLGCSHISTGLTALPWNPMNYAFWSLRDDAALRAEMIAAMRDRGVTIALGEGFAVRPDFDMLDNRGNLDIMAELGAKRVNGVSMDPDTGRANDQFAFLAELAAERGMTSGIEFAPAQQIKTAEDALAVVRHVGRPDFTLLVDSMHFFRSGGTVAGLATIDPALIGYIQLADVPLKGDGRPYLEEACFDRRVPGEGELPLKDFLAALPRDLPIGLEIPMLAKAEAGLSPHDIMGPAVKAAEALLAAID
jgi:sugar phosphate isomerase/epimerase